VTDIDDKIIKRARLNRLLDDFIAQVRTPLLLVTTSRSSFFPPKGVLLLLFAP
jgi:cysteinyl-tRNA synthetase